MPGKGYKALVRRRRRSLEADLRGRREDRRNRVYLIEQEGSDLSELETAKRCLENFRKLQPA